MNERKFFARVVDKWPAKVLSLILAIFLYIFHRMSLLEARFFFTPLVIENQNTMMPSTSYPRMIRVSLRGEATDLFSISENDIETYIDIEKFSSPGTYDVPVQWRKKGAALELEPLQITVEPAAISFSLDYKISKFVPIVANFQGNPDAGFNLASYSLNPNQIIIEGPAAIMGKIPDLNTEPIDLSGRRSDFSLTATILRQDPLITIRGRGTTEFSAAISRIVPIRNILNVPIEISGLKGEFTGDLEIKFANIRLEGDNREALDAFELESNFLTVDCSEINEPGTYILSVIAGNTESLDVRVEPQEVKIGINLITEQ